MGPSAHIKGLTVADIKMEGLEDWIGVHGAIVHNVGAEMECIFLFGWFVYGAEDDAGRGVSEIFIPRLKKPPTASAR